MSSNTEKRTSLRASANAAVDRVRFGAFTDWLVVICATLLTALDKFPAEWALWLFVGVAGLVGVLKGMGKHGGVSGLLYVSVKKVFTAIGIGTLLLGCGAGSGTKALEIIAPIAAKVLTEAAKARGIELDEAGAICVPLDEGYGDVEIPGVFAVCYAPEVE